MAAHGARAGRRGSGRHQPRFRDPVASAGPAPRAPAAGPHQRHGFQPHVHAGGGRAARDRGVGPQTRQAQRLRRGALFDLAIRADESAQGDRLRRGDRRFGAPLRAGLERRRVPREKPRAHLRHGRKNRGGAGIAVSSLRGSGLLVDRGPLRPGRVPGERRGRSGLPPLRRRGARVPLRGAPHADRGPSGALVPALARSHRHAVPGGDRVRADAPGRPPWTAPLRARARRPAATALRGLVGGRIRAGAGRGLFLQPHRSRGDRLSLRIERALGAGGSDRSGGGIRVAPRPVPYLLRGARLELRLLSGAPRPPPAVPRGGVARGAHRGRADLACGPVHAGGLGDGRRPAGQEQAGGRGIPGAALPPRRRPLRSHAPAGPAGPDRRRFGGVAAIAEGGGEGVRDGAI